ncbi:MAG: 1-deoxy-D-xylulose-5-phosphate reductoisomerase [Alphaproteobacteria bacterium]|nr:1-deoxy-D-xylulose-5-phosphate reductoisomerase [Alphaproteobacteria bacterium]
MARGNGADNNGADKGAPEQARRVTILGSTGSVGVSTIDLIAREPERFSVVALTANRNVNLLIEQARKLRPQIAAIGDESLFERLRDGLQDTKIEIAAGADAIADAAAEPADWVMAGIVGAAGLRPTLAAIKTGTIVALANKECLVCAGSVVMAEAERSGCRLLPVDSEHNAIFQVFETENVDAIERLILTASGGPFRTKSLKEMADMSPEEAVAHPNWDMGAKISVDSATMMNKGLELVEASYLFPVPEAAIEILVHPQSIIHSMVGYKDGSVLAQLGSPDMRTPIAHTLAWPHRMAAPVERLDLAKFGSLTFENPDFVRFPALRLAREALRDGQGATTVLNAANEVAVGLFLKKRIKFLDIASIVEDALARISDRIDDDLDAVIALDRQTREVAESLAISRG